MSEARRLTPTLPQDPALKQMRRLVVSELRRYRDHEDWDDIVQEAWLKSWEHWQRLEGRYALSTVVKVCAHNAFMTWVRSRKGRRQWRPPGRRKAPEWSFLEDLKAPLQHARGEDDDDPTEWYYLDMPAAEWPAARDPGPQVVHRLGCEQEARLALAAMTPRQQQMVRATVMGESTYSAAAIALGVTTKTVWKLTQTGLRNGRQALKETP